jgi:acyl carrier protein phosphodiesterase
MNYLAHAFLSPEDPLILMGNLWGDLLRPRDYEFLAPSLLKGIERHKMIDAFTDQHKAVDEIVSLLRPYQGKYTPVVVDVLMDFILSKFWHQYHEAPIEVFCQSTYKVVDEHLDFIPARLHPRINRMLSHQWLESCKNRERMERTLDMLNKRAAFDNTIPEAMLPYDLHTEQMDRLFILFFEDMQLQISLQNED